MADFERITSSPTATYEEGLAFFRGQGVLNRTLHRITADFERNGIDYAVIGAIALNQHGYKRFTEDVDVLVTREGLERFRERLVGLGYRPAFEGARTQFLSVQDNVRVELVMSGDYPGDGLPKPVRFPHPNDFVEVIDGVRTMTLAKLVELKLASGMTALDRLKDLADVQEVVRVKDLDAAFAEKLDESVRSKYLELQGAVASAKARDGGPGPQP